MNKRKFALMATPFFLAIMVLGTSPPVFAGNGIGILVDIDIKPGSFPNSINPDSRGVIPVAVLGSDFFDPTEIDPTSLEFMAADDIGPYVPNVKGFGFEDVNDDGFVDLVAHFQTQDTWINCGTIEGKLHAYLFDGTPIQGFDSVNPVPCRD